MAKDKRNFLLTIQPDINSSTFIQVKDPFTIEFDVDRNTLSSASNATIKIFNLGVKTRNLIRKDAFDFDNKKGIDFKAGYGNNLSTVFRGNISQAFNNRQGVNMVTEIKAFDGGYEFANAFTDKQFPAGTKQRTVIKNLADSLSEFGVQTGVIGDYPGTLDRGNSYSGSTTDLLRELTSGGFFIDNGKANCLRNSECISGEVRVINAQTGLLGTPRREDAYLVFDILFEPQLFIGQKVQLISQTAANFNGFYIVKSLHHHGIISESLGGQAVTSVGLFAPKNIKEVMPEQ